MKSFNFLPELRRFQFKKGSRMLGMMSTNNRGLYLVTCIVLFCVVAVSGIQGNPKEKPTYSIDVVAVVDYLVYKKFLTEAGSNKTAAEENIREYYAFIFDGVDQRYQSIPTDYTIRVFLGHVMVLKTVGKSPFATRDSIDVYFEEAMLKFKSLIAKSKSFFDKYDHVMLFTAIKLKEKETGEYSLGISYSSTICEGDDRGVSIIHEKNDYESIHLAAHELGHSLSAEHDGEGNNCSSTERYIMSAGYHQDTTKNQAWHFSTCSLKKFTSYFQDLLGRGKTCLTESIPRASNIPDVSGRLLGQEIQPDQQCQLFFGPSSGYRRNIANKGSIMCLEMKCYDSIIPRAALDGTTCGNLKICRFGQCVSDPRAPEVEESCIFGDRPGNIYDGKTCRQFVDSPLNCFNPFIQQSCCKSCPAVDTSLKAISLLWDDGLKTTYCRGCFPRPLLSGCHYEEVFQENGIVCYSNASRCCYFCASLPAVRKVHSKSDGGDNKWTWLLPLIFILAVFMVI